MTRMVTWESLAGMRQGRWPSFGWDSSPLLVGEWSILVKRRECLEFCPRERWSNHVVDERMGSSVYLLKRLQEFGLKRLRCYLAAQWKLDVATIDWKHQLTSAVRPPTNREKKQTPGTSGRWCEDGACGANCGLTVNKPTHCSFKRLFYTSITDRYFPLRLRTDTDVWLG